MKTYETAVQRGVYHRSRERVYEVEHMQTKTNKEKSWMMVVNIQSVEAEVSASSARSLAFFNVGFGFIFLFLACIEFPAKYLMNWEEPKTPQR